jgi:hypothetical protein
MIAMGDIVQFSTSLLNDHELIADLCRFAEGVFSEQEVRKRHRLADSVWKDLGANDELVEKIEAEKIRRIRDGSAKRELAQKHIVRGPTVLGSIMDDANASPRHRVDAIKTLDSLAANGPEKAPAADRFIISIHLGADVEHYNKSRAIDANDPDDISGTTPNVVAAITAKKPQDDDNGGEHI